MNQQEPTPNPEAKKGRPLLTVLVLVLFLLGLLLFLRGERPEILAVVNGELITGEDMDRRLERLTPGSRAALGNDRRRLLEEMIMETLLLQEARRRGLEKDPEVLGLLKEANRQILLGRLLELVRQAGPSEVSDKEISDLYSANPGSFAAEETFRASHILLDSEEKARQALARVKGGEPFAKVAEELSLDPTKSRGGDLGPFSKGQLIPEFEAALKKLKPGEVSDVVKTPLGYHVILLTEHRPRRERPLEEVREEIRRQILLTRQQRSVESFIQGLRAKAQIVFKGPFSSAKAASSSISPSSSSSSNP